MSSSEESAVQEADGRSDRGDSWKRDPEVVAVGLQRWAADTRGASITDVRASSAGSQNDTILFSLDGEPTVARLGPAAGTPNPTFPSYDLAKQARVMQLVGERTEARVPTVIHLEQSDEWVDSPFLVMEALPGITTPDMYAAPFGSWFRDGTPEQWDRFQRSTVELAAKVHQVVDDGSDDFAPLRPGPFGTPVLHHLLDDLQRYHDWIHDGRPVPMVAAGIEQLRRTAPAVDRVGISWGDCRPGNVLYQDFTATAALDWELATTGPAELDVAWITMFQKFDGAMATMLGVGDDVPVLFAEDLVRSAYAAASGRELADLAWYEAYSGVKLAAIMSRETLRRNTLAGQPLPDDLDDSFYFRTLLEQLLGAL